MELEINCLTNELKKIINDKNKYSSETILYALGLIEIISLINKINIMPLNFIKYLNKIRENINCYIDFEYLNYICKNKKKIFIKETSTLCNSSSSTGSLISNNLDDEIENMLKDDLVLLNELIENEEKLLNIDEYGKINNKILKLIKIFFDLLDFNKDGYICALDAIKIIKINKKYPLLFVSNFEKKIVDLLIADVDNKIDFFLFNKYLLDY